MKIRKKHAKRLGFDLKYPCGYIDKDGYVRVAACFKNNFYWWAGYQTSHRLIVSFWLGRLLRSEECVHHKNKDRQDNWYANLEVMLRSDHQVLSLSAARKAWRSRKKVLTSPSPFRGSGVESTREGVSL